MKSHNIAKEPQVAYTPEILSLDQLDLSGRYSYAEYFRWKFEDRVELIKGFIHKMSPAPSPTHQSVSLKMGVKLSNFFEGKPCVIFTAPFDVRLPDSEKQMADDLVYTVVQPDLCVICDLRKIDRRGCVGAPDLVIEILSPGNTQKEMGIKFRLYEENGVREYWFADPAKKTIIIYSLQEGKYVGHHFSENEEIRSVLFSALKFKTGEVFDRALFERFENIAREPQVEYLPELSPSDSSKTYTFADYLQWPYKEGVELIRGIVYKKEVCPDAVHQKAAGQLASKLIPFFENKGCRCIPAPFSIRLPAAENKIADHLISTVIQPDMSVFSDPGKTDDLGGTGVPDLIIEILNAGSTQKNVGVKYQLYREHGVKEYWWVDPIDRVIFIHVLRNGEYVVMAPFTEDAEICSVLFPELRFSVKEIFE